VSDRDAFRAEQQTRRQFGKAKQHEKRLERAVRKAVAEEIATALMQCLDLHWTDRERTAAIALEIGSRDPA
jgi:hypothetical protein